ncbi:hypothetical protein [Methylobacterium sp. yr668]|uniref:hypothetical protein n=1 Tax=Methylobacterium sp. yr668 TaxID=1761801 RepID=UPI0008E30213|nr:hypothetical protein [Methylobacterium sp. yr668]SFT11818.1 hypothetical protein SAMN04487845_11736 [Methylobacterium sp. yr668]
MGLRYTPPAPSCASCRHFALNPHPAEFGACRRHAPRPADGKKVKAAIWPGVIGTDRCGEYEFDCARAGEYAVGESRA